jgi:hypothetical protein
MKLSSSTKGAEYAGKAHSERLAESSIGADTNVLRLRRDFAVLHFMTPVPVNSLYGYHRTDFSLSFSLS